ENKSPLEAARAHAPRDRPAASITIPMRGPRRIDEGQITAPHDAAQHYIQKNQHDARCRVCSPRPFLPSPSGVFRHYTKVVRNVTDKLVLGGFSSHDNS